MSERIDAHFVVSASITALRLGEDDLGARRVMVRRFLEASVSIRVLRMLEPTRPVEPMIAVDEVAIVCVVLGQAI